MEFGTTSDEKFAVFNRNSTVDFYFNDLLRLQTDSAGIKLTGPLDEGKILGQQSIVIEPDDTPAGAAGTVTINGDFKPSKKLLDTDGDPGSSGQVLVSTGTGINWATDANITVNRADNANKIKTQKNSTNAYQFLTFVNSDNDSPGADEDLYTDGSIEYNPNLNVLRLSSPSATQLDRGALWLSGASGAILLEDATKRISFNDGGGDITIRAGCYYNGAEKYAVDNQGATKVQLTSDGGNGAFTVRVRNKNISNVKDNPITYDSGVSLNSTTFTRTSEAKIDLGTNSQRWGTVYADTFDGSVTGTADGAEKLLTVRNQSNTSFYLTFVDDNASTASLNSFYTDASISYNPNGNKLTVTNAGITNLDVSTSLSLTGTIDTNVLPDANNTYDIGESTKRWKTVYATTFDGSFNGTADKAKEIETASINTNASYFLTFVDTNSSTRAARIVYTDGGISYNPGTNLLTTSNATIGNILRVNGNIFLGSNGDDNLNFNAKANTTLLPRSDSINIGAAGNRFGTIFANTFNGSFSGTASQADLIKTITKNDNATFYPTFVDDNNNVGEYNGLFTDGDISFNPNAGKLTIKEVLVNANLTVNGGSTLGANSNTDIIIRSSFTGNIVPKTTNAIDIGTGTKKWRTIYATTFDGAVSGTADKADKILVSGASNTAGSIYQPALLKNGVSGDYDDILVDGSLNWDASKNDLYASGIIASGRGSGETSLATNDGGGNANLCFNHTRLTPDRSGNSARISVNVDATSNPQMSFYLIANVAAGTAIPLDNATQRYLTLTQAGLYPGNQNGTMDLGSTGLKWDKVYANTFIGTVTGAAQSADKLTNARNIAITGDLAWNVNFDGSANVSAAGTLATVNSTTGTFGSSTTVPKITVNEKGLVTSVITETIDLSGLGVPIGTVIWFAGIAAPSGYLVCNGSVFSNGGIYANLFSVISTRFNTGGESASQFRLPNLERRFIAGKGPGGTYDVGDTGGSENVTLTVNQIPQHAHPLVNITSDANITSNANYTLTGGGHSHNYARPNTAGNKQGDNRACWNAFLTGGFTTGGTGEHNHSLNLTSNANVAINITGNTGNAGNSQAHPNIPPYLALLPCIKYE